MVGDARHQHLHVPVVVISHIDCSEVYAGSSYYNGKRWLPFDGLQPESTPIVAGFRLPPDSLVSGGLDFRLPDGRTTGYIENVRIDDVSIIVKGGHPATDSLLVCPEIGLSKFNIRDLKVQPSYGFWARHVKGLHLNDVQIEAERPDRRPKIILDDVIE